MRKHKLYRLGSALLAAVMVFTCVPQTGAYALAEEVSVNTASQNAEAEETSGSVTPQSAETEGQAVTVSQPETDKTKTATTQQAETKDEAGGEAPTPTGDDNQNTGASEEDDVTPNGEGDTTAPEEPKVVPVESVTLDQKQIEIQNGKTTTVKHTVAPNNATNKNVTYSKSTDESVAVVAQSGDGATITAVGVGTASFTVTTEDGSKTDSCTIKVTPIPLEKIVFDPPAELTMELSKDESNPAKKTVKVNLVPENTDNKKLILQPGYDEEIIGVEYDDENKQIEITAKKAGRTTVALSALQETPKRVVASFDVLVDGGLIAVKSISKTEGCPEKLFLSVDNSTNYTRYVAFNPLNATNKKLKWSVPDAIDKPYVEVNSYGQVTAKWPDDDKSATKEVTVKAELADTESTTTVAPVEFKITIKRKILPLKSISVSPEKLVLEDGGKKNNHKTISVLLDPVDSTDRKIKATVNEKTSTGTKTVVVNEGKGYDEEHASNEAEGEADKNGRIYFTVKANELGDKIEEGNCEIIFSVVTISKDGTESEKEMGKCSVTVNKFVAPVDKLTLDKPSISLKDGEDTDLTATILPLAAENKEIIWTVDNPDIVTIEGPDENGKTKAEVTGEVVDGKDNRQLQSTVTIKAGMVGECTITATAAGEVEATCKVTITDGSNSATGLTLKSSISENTTEITLKKGKTFTLTPKVTPDTPSTNKTVKWTSESPTVVSVERDKDGNGVVTAKELTDGCKITARASGSNEACTKTVTVHVVEPHMEVKRKGNPTEAWVYTPEDTPITEEMLRNELEVSFWPVEHPVPEKDRQTLEKGGTHDYELKILMEDGKTSKKYEQEDMEKPGTKTLVIVYAYEGKTYQESIQLEMKEFTDAELISVTQLSGDEAEVWNVENGTPAASLPLAKTTEIVVGRKVTVEGKEELKTSRLDVEIEWKTSELDYNPGSAEKQDFTAFGEVKLPDYVNNPNEVSKTVQAKVHVLEARVSGKKVARPTFSVLGGETIGNKTAVELPYGSKIEILTQTDEEEVYYMVDRRPDEVRGIPKDEEHKYSKPIEITSKTTTIYAVATKSGCNDSDCSELTIKLVQAEPVDPDDPNAGPLPDDVTDEDKEQIGGKVPDGLWAVVQFEEEEEKEKGGFAYTGKAIKPAVHVYDRTMLLTEKKDYTVSYKNNVNAGDAKGSAKPPTVTVTGKGNYEGKSEVYFTIIPQDITDDSVFMDSYVAVAYNGKAQKPNPSLTWNGKKLSKNRDYTYTDASYTEEGLYKIEVTGAGNYTGTRTMDYEIYKGGVAVSKLTFSKIPNQKYTGSEIRPEVTVKYKKTTLQAGTEKGSSGNYWIKYENCTKVGTASIVIMGKGNYKGSKRINFKILPVDKISKAGITLDVPAAGVAYNGKPHTPKCTLKYGSVDLKENKDYKLNYQNNIKAGKATVVITGMGAYTGTVKKTFKILQNDISGLAAVMDSSFVYEKGGCKPKPTVTCDGIKLKEGTDYTLTYKNNNKIGNTASVKVKGKGNYKGEIVRYFSITMQELKNLQVVAADKAYQQKKNIYKTKIQVIDLNGKALSAGTDYSKDIYYTYESGSKAGQPVLSTDIIPVGTVIGVDIRAIEPRCYLGSIHGTYRIVHADISGAKVSVMPQEYTGRSVRPTKSQIQVTVKGVLLGKDDYEIVGYENNINQGTAKITIKGVGSYGGTKTATFKIKKRGILNLKF